MAQRSLSNILLVIAISSLYFVTLFWATSASAPAASAAPLRVGVILPLTGPLADIGNSALIGAQVAVEEINSVGGYLGRPLELVVHDDQSNPDIGLKAAQDLVQQAGAIGTVGICNTSVAMRVEEYYQAHKHPLIVSCATGSSITADVPAAQSFTFRTSANSSIQAQFLINELLKGKLRKIALLVDNSAYGDAGLKDLQTAMNKAGIKPRIVMRFNNGSRSLDKEMQELKASGADALIGWALGPDQGVIAASRAAIGWQVPQYGGWDLSNSSAYAASNGKADGVQMVQTVLPNRHLERNSAFLTAYGKRSRERPMGSMMSAAQTYDAVQMLMRAVFASKGDTSGPAIKSSLENMHEVYRGVVTTYDRAFTKSDHDAVTINMLWLGTWRNGDRTYFYDEDEKRASVIRHKR